MAHSNYVQGLTSDDKDNKTLWSYIQSKKKDNTGTPDLKSGQTLIQDPETKDNMFNALTELFFQYIWKFVFKIMIKF